MRAVASFLTRVTPASARPSLWIALAAAGGVTGLGEASPLAPFSRDDLARCQQALRAIHGRLDEIDEALPAATAVTRALRPVESALASAPTARFALETALLDLLGRRRGVSVAELLGGARPYATAGVNALLVADSLEGLADRAAALAAQGYPAIKIKLRARDEAGFARELVALRAVRARLPLPFELRLDPNGAWTLAEARRRLDALAPIAPRFVEQPVAAHELAQLGPCGVPWAADESLADPALVEPLLSARGCAVFILKPAILGGLVPALRIAERAQERGLDVVVTHLFDGPVAMAAAAELALSLPRAPLACGLAFHQGLGAWPNVGVPQLDRVGLVVATSAPGLGLRGRPGERTWATSALV